MRKHTKLPPKSAIFVAKKRACRMYFDHNHTLPVREKCAISHQNRTFLTKFIKNKKTSWKIAESLLLSPFENFDSLKAVKV